MILPRYHRYDLPTINKAQTPPPRRIVIHILCDCVTQRKQNMRLDRQSNVQYRDADASIKGCEDKQ